MTAWIVDYENERWDSELLTHSNELDDYKHRLRNKMKEVTPENVLCNQQEDKMELAHRW